LKRFDRARAAALLLLVPVLSGCWDMKEVEHMFYANAIGIDREDGQYVLYVQLLDFTTLGRSETGVSIGPGTGAVVGRARGEAFNIALHKLYASAQRRIFWGHLNTIVFGENLLKEDYLDVMEQITRYYEFRYVHWLFGTRDPIDQLFNIVPILEYSPVYSQMNDPRDVYNQSSQIKPMRLYRFIREMNEPGMIPLLPSMALSPPMWYEGDHPKHTLEMEGYFLIENRKLVGFLDKREAIGIRWLDPDMRRSPLIIGRTGDPVTPGPNEEDPVAIMMFRHKKSRVIPVYEGSEVRFDLDLAYYADLYQETYDLSISELLERAKKQIASQIRHTYEKGLEFNADPLHLLYSVYRDNPSKWREIQGEGENFPLKKDSLRDINIDIRLKFEGKTTKPIEDYE
jgi:Ger(x)C family germination protein